MRLNVKVLLIEGFALIIMWHLASKVLHLPYFPLPFMVLRQLITELPNKLGYHLLISLVRVTSSIALAIMFAMPLALLTAQSTVLDEMLTSLAYLVYPVPKIVFLPLLILSFGIGEASKIALLVLVISFQVFVIVRDVVHHVRPEMLDSVRSLGASKHHLLIYVYLPICIPAVLTALRVSVGTAVAVLFFAESFATRVGLGYYVMVETWGRMAYTEMYAGILAMSILGLLLYALIGQAERHLCRWAQGT